MLNSLDTLNADYAIIDTPGKADTISAMAIRKANVALIVIQASAADIWAAAATVKMVNTRIELGGKIDVAFLVNRVVKNTKLTNEIVAGEWNEYHIDQLTATVGNRTVFAQSLSDGMSVYDYDNADAKREIDALITELEAARWL